MSIQTKKLLRIISKIVLVLASVFVVGYVGYSAYLSIRFKPTKVRVTNVTSSSATVSWVTDTPMKGVVYYKAKDSFLPGPLSWIGSSKAWDDRDVSDAEVKCVEDFNAQMEVDSDFSVDMSDFDCTNTVVKKVGKYYTHHVTLKNLDSEKQYYFRVGDGILSWKGDVTGTKTFSMLESVEEPKPVFGRVGNSEREYTDDSIIYIKFKDFSEDKESVWLSSATNSDGGWYLDASNALYQDGTVLELSSGDDILIAQAQYKSYTLGEERELVYGYFDGSYPDILVPKEEVKSNLFSVFGFNYYQDDFHPEFNTAGYSHKEEDIDIVEVEEEVNPKPTNSYDQPEFEEDDGEFETNSNGYVLVKQDKTDGQEDNIEKALNSQKEVGFTNMVDNYIASVADNNGPEINRTQALIDLGYCKDSNQCASNISAMEGVGITNKTFTESQSDYFYVGAVNNKRVWQEGEESVPGRQIVITKTSLLDTVKYGEAESIGNLVRMDGALTLEIGSNTYSEDAVRKILGDDNIDKLLEGNCILNDADCEVEIFTYEISLIDLLNSVGSSSSDTEQAGYNSNFLRWENYINSNVYGPEYDPALTQLAEQKEQILEIEQSYYIEYLKDNPDEVEGFEYVAPEYENISEIGFAGQSYAPSSLKKDECVKITEWNSEILSVLLNDTATYSEGQEFIGVVRDISGQLHTGGTYRIGEKDGKSVLYWKSDMSNPEFVILDAEELDQLEVEISVDTYIAMQEAMNGKAENQYVSIDKNELEVGLDEHSNYENYTYRNDAGEIIEYDIDQAWLNYSNCRNDDFSCNRTMLENTISRLEESSLEINVTDWYDIQFDPGYEYWLTRGNQIKREIEQHNYYKTQVEGSSLNLVPEVKAAETTSETDNYAMYLPEYGMFSMQLGTYEFDKQISDGNAIYLFYIETNGIEGLQIPQDIDNPGLNDDTLLKSSAFEINYAQESSIQKLEVKEGINIVSFDFMTISTEKDNYSASDIILEGAKRDVDIEYVTYFEGGRWREGYRCDRSGCQGTDFTILPGKGYLIYSNSEGNIYLPAYELLSPVPIAFSAGWNLVGVHGYQKAFTARTFIDSVSSIEGLTADNVSWWPTSKSKYEGIQVTDGQTYGQDFSISSSNGYFVRISEYEPTNSDCKSIIWHYNGSLNGTCGNSRTIF